MAKETVKLNYGAEIKELSLNGPRRLYLLWGKEDYLKERYLEKLKQTCIPEGEDDFSYRRLDGPELLSDDLQQALDSVPFMTERTFVEIRNADINKLKNSEEIIRLLSDIPDYCTCVFTQQAEYEPDGRLKLIKTLKTNGKELQFTTQSTGDLTNWISKRFAAAGKSIELEAAQRLMFISGTLMSRLIPEIDKISAYAKGDKITVNDVEAVANRIPEAVVFDMTDFIAEKKFNSAMAVLAELLSDKNNDPIPILAMLGMQMRRLYAARMVIDFNMDSRYLADTVGIKNPYALSKTINTARGFTLSQLKKAVELCAETDYRIKSSSEDDAELLKECVLRIAAGECNA